jgi:hypothetical protein
MAVPNDTTADAPILMFDRIWSHDAARPQVLLSNCCKQTDGADRLRRPAACASTHRDKEIQNMLWTIAVILLVLWALGLTTAYTASGLIHILLVLAIVVVLIRVIQGRRAI